MPYISIVGIASVYRRPYMGFTIDQISQKNVKSQLTHLVEFLFLIRFSRGFHWLLALEECYPKMYTGLRWRIHRGSYKIPNVVHFYLFGLHSYISKTVKSNLKKIRQYLCPYVFWFVIFSHGAEWAGIGAVCRAKFRLNFSNYIFIFYNWVTRCGP